MVLRADRPVPQSAGEATASGLRHLAIIPDGNRRWARRRGRTDTDGHDAGVETFWRILPELLAAGIPRITMFLFSTENWARAPAEVDALLHILARFFRQCRERSPELGFATAVIGDVEDDRLPALLCAAIGAATAVPARPGAPVLTFGVNYGSTQALTRAHDQGLQLTPVDLMVRTGGQRRLSNFLLLESAYAELSFLDLLWPDLTVADMRRELDAYRERNRTFGGDGGS